MSLGGHGFLALDPASATTISLLGGEHHGAVAVTRSQLDHLKRVYSVTPESAQLAEAFAVSSTFRRATDDGLRCMALIAKLLEPGQDPALFLAEILGEAGFDTQPWGESEEDGAP